VPPEESNSLRRLSDLRRAAPADATFQNLLAVMTEKLDLCARLPIYEYEAGSEGHEHSARTFHALADAERQSFQELVACLQEHMLETGIARDASDGVHEGRS
jgi:hypothetical protein